MDPFKFTLFSLRFQLSHRGIVLFDKKMLNDLR
jgi:hypothetical protein